MARVKQPQYGTPDEENPLWTEEDFAKAIPFPELARQMGWKMPGRPKAAVTKVPTNLRLDPDILAYFKADGEGWQTRINAVLAKHVKAANAAASRKKKAS
ncbi:MAG: hypothetical protein EOP22_14685 [Hyphomicrobiales bacterium]|nr:MAG: hypothetical protein EOP22_14685 [Hyphomicrobiales bacterium]